MINKTSLSFEFKGVHTQLSYFLEHTGISKTDIVSAVMEDKIDSPMWTDETTRAKKILDIMKGEVIIYNIYLEALINRVEVHEDYNKLVHEVQELKDLCYQVAIMQAETLELINEIVDNDFEDNFITMKEAAELLNMSRQTIYANKHLVKKNTAVYYYKKADINIVFYMLDVWRTSKNIILDIVQNNLSGLSKAKTTKLSGRPANKRKAKRLS